MEEPASVEYIKLWLKQSQLLWGRLQTVTVLHTAVFVAWYQLRKEDSTYKNLSPVVRAHLKFLQVVIE